MNVLARFLAGDFKERGTGDIDEVVSINAGMWR